MNGDQVLQIIIKAKDQASATLDKFSKKLENNQAQFQKLAAIGTAALVGITAVAYKSLQAYAEVERANRQLEHAVIAVSKGTAEQVKQIQAVTTALEKKAGVDADSLNMGVAQLSTFGLQTKSVIGLTKSLADFTVNQNGLNASADQYISSANIMAKALKGQFGLLEKQGIRFTEAQQKLIKYGSETEKVAALNEGFAQNLRETTDTVAGIDLATAKLNRTMENIKENIGKAVAPAFAALAEKIQPIIEKFATWAEQNPDTIVKILAVGAALAGLAVIVGGLGLVLPTVIAGFAFLASPIGLVAVAVTGLVVLLVGFRDKLTEIFQSIDEKTGLITIFKWAWDQIYTTFSENLLPALQRLWEALKPLEPILVLIAKLVGGVLLLAIDAIVLAITGWIQIITNVLALGAEFAKGIADFFIYPIKTFIDMVKSAIEYVGYLIDKMSQIGGGVKGAVSSIGKKVGKILGFEHGGQVPGARGQAVPIIAHAGETIIPAGKRAGGGDGVNIVLNLNYPSFKSKEDIETVRSQIDYALRDVVRIYKLQPNG